MDDGSWMQTVNTGTDFSSWTLNWENLIAGKHTLYVQAKDRANNIGQQTPPTEVFVNLLAPTVQDFVVNPNPAKAGETNFTIIFASNKSGMDNTVNPEVYFMVSGYDIKHQITQISYVGNQWTGKYNIATDMPNGTAIVFISNAKDNLGNTIAANDTAGQFIIDTIAPTVKKLETPLTDGAYLWTVIAYDSAANEKQADTENLLRIDTTPPESQITNLTTGQDVIGPIFKIEGTADDGIGESKGIGVDSVFISFDGGSIWFPTTEKSSEFAEWEYLWSNFESKAYTIKSKAIDKLGNEEIPSDGYLVTDVEERIAAVIPKEFDLVQNYPNPFNPETSIIFQLPRKVKVQIVIFNQMGQVIKKLWHVSANV